MILWSSGFIGASFGTQDASTPALMFYRCVLAAGVLLAVALILRRRLPRRREIAVQSVVGLLGQGLYLTGVVGAVEFGVSAGTAALIAALQPLLAAALSGPVLGEDVMMGQWIGLLIGLVGVALVVGGDVQVGGDAPLFAYAMPFGGMASLVAASLVERRENLRSSDPGTESPAHTEMTTDVALVIQCVVSAVLFAALAPFWGGLDPTRGLGFWAAVGWFVVFSTIGGYGFYWLNLRLSGVARVSSLLYLTPPTTMVWAYLMFGDSVGLLAVIGLLICFFGVVLANRGT